MNGRGWGGVEGVGGGEGGAGGISFLGGGKRQIDES